MEDTLGYYDVATGRQLNVISTSAFPHEICLSPDRKKIYIDKMGVSGIESEGSGGHTIAVYDAKTRALLSTIDSDPGCDAMVCFESSELE